ncbi:MULTISPECIES: ribulose-phosphate 3-epimerase [unclassified Nitratiruptor]|uniref:ribulose-phosphate 3-epimerase n=1 Tax=unclassified Nitratiruptor TaxID=2624044 RepID=UPI001915C8E4|nr:MULTISPECIES: ribulose-phosphate 3-epimerase [unclassified Nitratiruptor]BCD59655.1 ribulose-phosphate 3-epimerase [Nitratiruptor sp. YY08-10]BCD63579.1 ribulose-phosphate 3-epimerase [Nitratiruptor sp. YY08-14]
MLVAPSILSADFGILAKEVIDICEAGADLVHVDVMDGHFVPNMTIGPVVAKAVAAVATKPLDVHLMVEDNSFFIDLFASLKPKFISFHYESEQHHHRAAQKIRDYGISPAIVINPATPVNVLEEIIKYVDMVLLMSVNPGFGGQKFIPIFDKIKQTKELIEKHNPSCLIEVDGGVSDKNIHELKAAGVDVAVAGSYVFGHKDYAQAIASLKV